MKITKTLKNLDIYNNAIAIVENFKDNLNLPVKVNFYLQKNITSMVEMGKEIERAREEIVNKYKEGEEIPEDKLEEVNQEIIDLFNLEQEISFNSLKLDWFDNINLTSQQVAAISYMIEEEE